VEPSDFQKVAGPDPGDREIYFQQIWTKSAMQTIRANTGEHFGVTSYSTSVLDSEIEWFFPNASKMVGHV
jgi:hypothetical protein